MRYLAIDHGDKRTGLAVGSDSTGIVTPVGVIQATAIAELLREIAVAVAEHGPDELVIGHPLNMDGSEGPRAKSARALKGFLEQRYGIPVNLADERLSSFAAEQQLNQSGLTHGQKKARRDALAAAAILRGFLEQKAQNKKAKA